MPAARIRLDLNEVVRTSRVALEVPDPRGEDRPPMFVDLPVTKAVITADVNDEPTRVVLHTIRASGTILALLDELHVGPVDDVIAAARALLDAEGRHVSYDAGADDLGFVRLRTALDAFDRRREP